MMQINIRAFVNYKFYNSLFLGLSVGSIFILYTPLMPSVYSLGGIFLALGMLFIAKLYYKILNVPSFFKISLFIEFVLLFIVSFFLLFSYSYTSALVIYTGYQVSFMFGSYLIRAETLFLKHAKNLELVDVAKQKGYLLGMLLSYLFYKALEYFFFITDKEMQVYSIHFVLLCTQLLILFFLLKAFKKSPHL